MPLRTSRILFPSYRSYRSVRSVIKKHYYRKNAVKSRSLRHVSGTAGSTGQVTTSALGAQGAWGRQVQRQSIFSVYIWHSFKPSAAMLFQAVVSLRTMTMWGKALMLPLAWPHSAGLTTAPAAGVSWDAAGGYVFQLLSWSARIAKVYQCWGFRGKWGEELTECY